MAEAAEVAGVSKQVDWDQEVREFYQSRIVVTPEQATAIREYDQRTDDWHRARYGRITGSVFGSAVGLNPYCDATQLLMQTLWGTFKGNAACDYGTLNEPVAFAAYQEFLNVASDAAFSMSQTGLVVCLEHPWLAVSPDGLVHSDSYQDCGVPVRLHGPDARFPVAPPLDLDPSCPVDYAIEIKAPFKGKLYPKIPCYYYTQIMGQAAVLHVPFVDFVVWTPTETQITRYPFNPQFWSQNLFPALKRYYFEQLLPYLILKDRKLLVSGTLICTEDDTGTAVRAACTRLGASL